GDTFTYQDLTAEDIIDLSQSINVNAQRIPAVSAGALPTPTEPNSYMVVTGVGSYTYGGATIGTNANGYQTTFWWNGTAWSLNDTVELPMPEGTDSLEDELIPKGKAVANYVEPTIKKIDSVTERPSKQLFNKNTAIIEVGTIAATGVLFASNKNWRVKMPVDILEVGETYTL